MNNVLMLNMPVICCALGTGLVPQTARTSCFPDSLLLIDALRVVLLSVVMDITPGGFDPRTGVLMVSSKPRWYTTAWDFLIREVVVPNSSQITVQGLVDILTSG
jgi:hypothetical protein